MITEDVSLVARLPQNGQLEQNCMTTEDVSLVARLPQNGQLEQNFHATVEYFAL
jgi:hypothetical protein